MHACRRHGCRPNAESDVKPRKRKVFIRAIKNIKPGEEINYDYGTEYFKEFIKPIGCKCAACEKKREKKLAEAQAEEQRLKERAEKKARKEAEKLVKEQERQTRKALEKAQQDAKLKRKQAARKQLNGTHLNGHGATSSGNRSRCCH